MAVTSLWKISSNLNGTVNYIEDKNKTLKDLEQAINYANNKDKTEDMCYITGINCNVKYAKSEMKQVKQCFNKMNGVLGYHGYQSFKENEVTPELAHEIGIKLATEMWGDKYQVLVSTHLNTNHIHNHFVINSVSFIDGSKFNSCRATTAQLRNINDSICEQYGLSHLEEKETPRHKINFSYYLKSDKEHRINYYDSTKKDIDYFIIKAKSYSEFIQMLENNNYEVVNRYGKLSVRNKKYKRNIRIERYYGEEYSIENIKSRIIEENDINNLTNDEFITFNNYKKKHKIKSTGFIALYKYYCYLLKIYPTKYSRYPINIAEDLEQLNIYNNINNFIDKYNITSEDDFNNKKEELSNNYDEKYQLRRSLRNEYKKYHNDEVLNKIKVVNIELKELDKELNICFNIKNNVEHVNKNIEELENNRKERSINESIK